MMKKVALYGSLLALVGATAAYAQGQFPGYPLATSSPQSGNAVTLPLTGVEQIPADTMLSYGIQPQTEVISTSQLRTYVLSGANVSNVLGLVSYTIATLPTCSASLLGDIATVSNGTAYATGTYGSAVSATGAVTRVVVCTNTGGATTYAWAYN
jgi:hypothetical protein